MKKRISLIVMALIMVISIIPMFAIESEAAATYSFLWPVKNGTITPGQKYSSSHLGIDIVAKQDDTIYSSVEGKVIEVFNNCWHSSEGVNGGCEHNNTWGNAVVVRCTRSDNTTYDVIYGHLLKDTIVVRKNDMVIVGQPLATMGSSGYSYGKHLHLEVRGKWNYSSTTINNNSTADGGPVSYFYQGYEGDLQIQPANIAEGIYYFNNNGYRMYMKSDKKQVTNVLGCSDGSADERFTFMVEEEGDYYIITPTATQNGYIVHAWWESNCYKQPDSSAPTDHGDEVALYNKIAGDKSQRWIFEECNGGYLIHPADNPKLSVTRTAENRLYVTTTTKAANQIWVLEDATECSHTYGTTFVSNGTHHWKECTKCGDETEKEAHIYDNDCDTKCNVCSRERTVTHSYGATLKSDGTHHWKECTECGDQIQKATHSYDNDCDAYCNGCGRKRTVTHTYGATLKSDGTHHWKECTECGDQIQKATHSYDNDCDAYCNGCGRERTVTHTYGATLESNGTHHWKACTKCGAEVEKAVHSYDNACDATCNVCSRERTVAPHSYSATEHDGYTLYTCSVCGDNYKEFHTPEREECQTHSYDEGVVTKKATCTEVGKRKKTCSVCGHTETEDIPKTDHNFGEWFTSGSSDDTEMKRRDCKTCGEYEIKEIEKENTAKPDSIRDWLFDNTEVLLIVCCGVVVVSLLGVAIFKKRK